MPESFAAFTDRIPHFSAMSPTHMLTHTMWYLHTQRGKEYVTTSDINACFDEIHSAAPHTSVYLKRLSERKPPLFYRSRAGYKLDGKLRKEIQARFGEAPERVAISALLRDLLAKLNTPEERLFLEETLKCYSVLAFRAAIVMAWNLAYSHLERWLVEDQERIDRFNVSYAAKFPKRSERVSNYDSMIELKEFDVVETLYHAKLINKNVGELLKDKLKRRNAAAHPSPVHISQAQADDVISDLVHNVVVHCHLIV